MISTDLRNLYTDSFIKVEETDLLDDYAGPLAIFSKNNADEDILKSDSVSIAENDEKMDVVVEDDDKFTGSQNDLRSDGVFRKTDFSKELKQVSKTVSAKVDSKSKKTIDGDVGIKSPTVESHQDEHENNEEEIDHDQIDEGKEETMIRIEGDEEEVGKLEESKEAFGISSEDYNSLEKVLTSSIVSNFHYRLKNRTLGFFEYFPQKWEGFTDKKLTTMLSKFADKNNQIPIPYLLMIFTLGKYPIP